MPRYAAVDIGSNSVRLLVAQLSAGSGMQVLKADRQVTRLGESVFRDGSISPQSLQFVCGQLARMAQIYRKLDVVGVRAVATSAVRDARNQREFIAKASQALGVPVEIISGQEEARLIHLGVQARWPHPEKRLLIVDVGGGSAEIIRAENGRLTEAYSKPLGAVRLTEVFLKHDPPLPEELRRMDQYIEEKIATPIERLSGQKYDRMVATSATAAAVVCAIHRVPRGRREHADQLRATTAQIRRLYRTLSAANLAARRKLPGIGPRRAEIITAGTAVFLRVLETFRLPSLYYSAAGVRDGIIADLAARGVGRELSRLTREQRQAVEQMARRFGVSLDHARKVAALAHELFDGLQRLHRLPPYFGKLLEAAAYLHDIGHYVSDTSHHKHSAYLVENADMPGFTLSERKLIAMLCRYHRKSMPAPRHTAFQALDAESRRVILLLTPLLRLADNLDRSHEQRIDRVACQVRNGAAVVLLHGDPEADLEQWAAERSGEAFRQVYDVPLGLLKAHKEGSHREDVRSA
ncbi:MAG TPA: Ppx/GppA phosphatase family protein [Bryobacteraceae bacterium]|nr:Ppx/GppA phosphatase family protein [Bryobacteraceae bacterium]